ncbi:uncharacterized protein HMPREF1541_03256 [Cyphellophora europaea CBS 101466]|uniref:OTU domain-containing protein n=1 Tax=Cyphellophora europaea (strain CBS 101466) TaxID=1220924 RepID=W2RXT0_CYPE1|nr:uncharacterized protein HMPREF1541_03256 [Cyphellophora europaea CBS 101466]ETN41321.1 hypothetical protein HMPREF1541_03256 [Cyphellophora europaea CBS 101466]
MDELFARHRKEQRELQNRITSKKKNATKKTRKGVNDECESLERELREKQRAEVEALQPDSVENGIESLSINGHDKEVDDLENDGEDTGTAVNDEDRKQVKFDATAKDPVEPSDSSVSRTKKPNRQKARMARRAAEQEAQAAAAAEEAANLPDLREQEMSAMKTLQEKHGLIETFIRPDGHCLYSACALGMDSEQVTRSGPHSLPYQNVRLAAADFISKHPDDFSAFLEESLDKYVTKVKDTAEWGGQLELQAIARAYNVNIHVLQADGRVEEIRSGPSASEQPGDVWLAYYRHSFGLGEHYNALKKSEKT